MSHYEKIIARQEAISVVGLGYVGLPIAVAFAKHANVIGFDTNTGKIDGYMQGQDPTNEVGGDVVRSCGVQFTSEEVALQNASFHIVAVPTPVRKDNTPDLAMLIGATRMLGRNLQPGSIVVYESTVYPGVTEEVCVPLLEEMSGFICGVDFKVGYSPERINPGDQTHRLDTIVKIVSGMDEQTLDDIAAIYELVVKAGVYKAQSIKIAEAAKVIENSQRDINIAFMNELSIIFNKMNIDTQSVLKAAKTKWNFLDFQPGLVGGHCIGVDPYYLTYKAEELGYHSQIILSGRKINDDMGKYIAENTIKAMIHADVPIRGANVVIMGLTFKENCTDLRNTKVIDIIRELNSYGIDPVVTDPVASSHEAMTEYCITLRDIHDVKDADAVILAVAHQNYRQLDIDAISNLYRGRGTKVLIDVKGVYDREEYENAEFIYWRL